ncbi:lactadherin [Lingula anatina]|uniref:Lactadherin n=1 Tax=Lingula anatina TaxID=7574 RepID=A0A1S3JA67_LINAN|nr:lactadherin [Lingula anatina]|eukprot:XP_013407091.1 lactadherin [Lingula anatina]
MSYVDVVPKVLMLMILFSLNSALPPIVPNNTCQPKYTKDGKAMFMLELPVITVGSSGNQTMADVAALEKKVHYQEKLLNSQAILVMQQKQQLSQQAAKIMEMEKILHKLDALTPPEDCRDLLVSGKSPISDSQITASSSYNADHYPPRSRLYTLTFNVGDGGSWHAAKRDMNQWLQFDFGRVRKLTAVLTKGRNGQACFVTEYQVQYGNNTLLMRALHDADGKIKTFQGNIDEDTIQQNVLDTPVYARYLRINPVYWQHHICMRADVLGC